MQTANTSGIVESIPSSRPSSDTTGSSLMYLINQPSFLLRSTTTSVLYVHILPTIFDHSYLLTEHVEELLDDDNFFTEALTGRGWVMKGRKSLRNDNRGPGREWGDCWLTELLKVLDIESRWWGWLLIVACRVTLAGALQEAVGRLTRVEIRN